jgi:hypothetical protein
MSGISINEINSNEESNMKRVDLLKMQLLNSRGRFFTAKWVGANLQQEITANMKVSKILEVTPEYVEAEVYVPMVKRQMKLRFMMNAKGDCTYIASDKSKFEMTGQRAFNF